MIHLLCYDLQGPQNFNNNFKVSGKYGFNNLNFTIGKVKVVRKTLVKPPPKKNIYMKYIYFNALIKFQRMNWFRIRKEGHSGHRK